MQIIELNPEGLASQSDLDDACAILQAGGIIGYPTDTLYGLGVDGTSSPAVEKLYLLKQRAQVPMSIMLDSVNSLLEALENPTPTIEKLIRTFLPGQITIVGKCKLELADGVISHKGLTGMRVPDHPLNLALVKTFGKPITSTSANLCGYPSALNIETIIAYFSDRIDLIFDQRTFLHSSGSTVIDVSQEPFKILREGAITAEQLSNFLS